VEICENQTTFLEIYTNDSLLTYQSFQWQVDMGTGFQDLIDDDTYSTTNYSTLYINSVTESMGEYIFRCLISNACNEEILTSENITLAVELIPEIDEQPTANEICETEGLELAVVASGMDLIYQWQVDDGDGFLDLIDDGIYNNTSSSTLSISSVTEGMKELFYRCVVSNQCQSVITEQVKIPFITPPEIITQPADAGVCESEALQLELEASGENLEYQWQVDEGSRFIDLIEDNHFNNVSTAVLSISEATVNMNQWSFRCVVYNICLEQISDAMSLSIIPIPQFLVEPGDQSVCEMDEVQFEVEVTENGLDYQWQANEGGGFFDLDETTNLSGVQESRLVIFKATFEMDGNQYRCMVTGNCTDLVSNPALLTIDPQPSANFSFEIADNMVQLANLSMISASYTWDFGDGSPIAEEENPTHIYSNPGIYLISLTAGNDCGSHSFSQEIDFVISGIQESLTTFQLYPNPTQGTIKLSLPQKAKEIKIYDFSGAEVYYQKIENRHYLNEFEIDLTSLPKGIYFLHLTSNSGFITRRVLLQ